MGTLQTYLAVMAGGAVGVAARMFISNAIANAFGQTFPWGTLIVNVSGSFIIGFIASLTGPDGFFMTSPLVRQVLMLGVLGGFTTFSSFSLQTVSLFSDGEVLLGLANIFASVLLCLAGTVAGVMLANLLQPE